MLLSIGLVARAADPVVGQKPAAEKKPQVEVCFVLDTTGSMGGLIEGAKEKIWSIANRSDQRQADAGIEDRPVRLSRPAATST